MAYKLGFCGGPGVQASVFGNYSAKIFLYFFLYLFFTPAAIKRNLTCMDIVLSHTTALTAIRTLELARFFYPLRAGFGVLPQKHPPAKEIADLLTSWNFGRASVCAHSDETIHILLRRDGIRHNPKGMHVHQWGSALPVGSLVQLDPQIRCASPFLVPIQLAQTYSELELTLLFMELMGTYAISPEAPNGFFVRKKPLISKAQMLNYLKSAGPVKGIKHLRRSLAEAAEQISSPFAAELLLRAQRGFSKGGYALKNTILTHPADLKDLTKLAFQLQVPVPDLVCISPKEHVGAQCAGSAIYVISKTQEKQGLFNRISNLNKAGILVHTITTEHLQNLEATDELFYQIRKELGFPPRKSSKAREISEHTAREQLSRELKKAKVLKNYVLSDEDEDTGALGTVF